VRWPAFDVALLYQYSRTAGCVTGIDVAPAIPDQKARAQINSVPAASLKQQPRARFSARAGILIVVIAGKHVIDGQFLAQDRMHALDFRSILNASRDVRLVGNNNYQESRSFEIEKCGSSTRHDPHLFQRRRRIRFTISNDGSDNYAVTVQENCWTPVHMAATAAAASHFVSACFSAGCDTMRCHTTAWNASE
jgi:hypothetical protein